MMAEPGRAPSLRHLPGTCQHQRVGIPPHRAKISVGPGVACLWEGCLPSVWGLQQLIPRLGVVCHSCTHVSLCNETYGRLGGSRAREAHSWTLSLGSLGLLRLGSGTRLPAVRAQVCPCWLMMCTACLLGLPAGSILLEQPLLQRLPCAPWDSVVVKIER